MAIFEKFILMNIVKRIPIGIGLVLKSLNLIGCHCQCGIFLYAFMGALLLLLIPFDIVPEMQNAKKINKLDAWQCQKQKKVPCIVFENIIIIGQITIAKLLSNFR